MSAQPVSFCNYYTDDGSAREKFQPLRPASGSGWRAQRETELNANKTKKKKEREITASEKNKYLKYSYVSR